MEGDRKGRELKKSPHNYFLLYFQGKMKIASYLFSSIVSIPNGLKVWGPQCIRKSVVLQDTYWLFIREVLEPRRPILIAGQHQKS